MTMMTTLLGAEPAQPIATGEELASLCHFEMGSTAAFSFGSVALGDWLLARDEHLPRLTRWGWSTDFIVQMLADRALPEGDEAENLGWLTNGDVTVAMFERPNAEAEPEPDAPTTIDTAAMLHDAAPLCVVHGRLGETMPGPLFCAIDDPQAPREFVLSGLGLALRLDGPRATAMRQALDGGLRLIEARG